MFVFCVQVGFAQDKKAKDSKNNDQLNTYVIEREIPEVGNLTQADLKGISQKSCSVLHNMGSANIQWLHSYVAEDKIYCIYKAKSKEEIKEHAEKGGFPANSIMEVSNVISPETATGKVADN